MSRKDFIHSRMLLLNSFWLAASCKWCSVELFWLANHVTFRGNFIKNEQTKTILDSWTTNTVPPTHHGQTPPPSGSTSPSPLWQTGLKPTTCRITPISRWSEPAVSQVMRHRGYTADGAAAARAPFEKALLLEEVALFWFACFVISCQKSFALVSSHTFDMKTRNPIM